MNNLIQRCLITRLVITLASLVLAVIVAVLFSIGFFPAFTTLLPYTAAIGLIITLAILIAIISTRETPNRYCDICLGILTQVAALLLLLLSLIGISSIIMMEGIYAILFVGLLSLVFWMAVLGLCGFVHCLARRADC